MHKLLFFVVILLLIFSSISCDSNSEEVSVQTTNNEDIEWLSIVIASEAGSVYDGGRWVRCTNEERAAVGWTVINRLKVGTYGDSIKDIITAQNQYAHNQQPDSEINELTEKLLQGKIDDMTEGATHFFSPISMPKEGESTSGFDIGGGLHTVTGIDGKVYFPSWAETMNYVGDLYNIRQAYFMFYRVGEITQEPEQNTDEEVVVTSGKIIFKREGNLYIVNADGTNEIEIEIEKEIAENTITSPSTITPSPDGKKIVYQLLTKEGDPSFYWIISSVLYIVNSDGTNKTKIDEIDNYDFENICWSPDGKMISYNVDGKGFVLLSIDTLNQTWIDAVYLKWSPDSKRIIYQHSEGDWRILSEDGSELKLEEEMDSPVWSPDGNKIYYTEKPQGNLASINSDGTGKARVIPSSIGSGLKTIDVTDEKIIFATYYDYLGNPIRWGNTLWDANIDGTNQRKLIGVKNYIIYHGEKIAVTTYSYPSGGGDQLILDLETLEKTQLEQMPEVFSSDGKWIAYSEKDEWGDWYIYIINLDTMSKNKFVEGSRVFAWVT